MNKKLRNDIKNPQPSNHNSKKREIGNAAGGDQVKLDDKFRNLLPIQNDCERALLEDQLIRDGLKDPLTLWRGILVDGYLRFELCQVHNIPIHTRNLDVETLDEAINWKIAYELGRRHLNTFCRAEVALKQKDYFARLAAENKGKRTDKPATLKGQRFVPINTAKKLCELARCGKNTINDVEYILDNYPKVQDGERILAQARREERSIAEAKKVIKKAIEPKNIQPLLNFDYQNPDAGNWINQIICGDAVETLKGFNKTMAGQAAAVITSVPYNCGMDYKNDANGNPIEDNKPYPEYLGFLIEFILEAEKSVCDDGGRIIINCDNILNPDRDESDSYRYPLDIDLIQHIRRLNAIGKSTLKLYHRVIWLKGKTTHRTQFGSYCSCSNPSQDVVHEHILAFSKNSYTLANVTGNASDMDAEDFKFLNQSVWEVRPNTKKTEFPCKMSDELAERLVKYFTFPKSLIIDPFCGSGTILTAALKLNRDFLGIDLSPRWCNLSKNELQKVQDKIDGKRRPSDDEKYHFVA